VIILTEEERGELGSEFRIEESNEITPDMVTLVFCCSKRKIRASIQDGVVIIKQIVEAINLSTDLPRPVF
jgi:hypothetical protein